MGLELPVVADPAMAAQRPVAAAVHPTMVANPTMAVKRPVAAALHPTLAAIARRKFVRRSVGQQC